MLFNSIPFLVGFLPIVLAGTYLLARWHRPLAGWWLAGASVFFYGWWNPRFVLLLIASAAFNFAIGRAIAARRGTPAGRGLLAFGIGADIAVLAIYKYMDFFIANLDALGAEVPLLQLVLPLGISFFTFTQIAFLVDVHRAQADEYRFGSYLLFVSFFPHLIAGPIYHHRHIVPQFERPDAFRFSADRLADGLLIFLLGLAKKVLIADRFGAFADDAFAGAASGQEVSLFAAWGAALSYTMQIYFDFSGYTDMAIGLGRMLGVQLPPNFNSPYRATSIIDFWRRWHMTLSAFLREYLYIPLGGNRRGPARRYLNIMIVMILGGLWHGAGWTFVAWGTLHGLLLVANHGWRALRPDVIDALPSPLRLAGAWSLTFACVVVAWVLFRATSLDAAIIMLRGMAGLSGAALPASVIELLPQLGAWIDAGVRVPFLPGTIELAELCVLLAVALAAVLWLPNVHRMPTWGRYALLLASAAFVIQNVAAGTPSPFLYFQF